MDEIIVFTSPTCSKCEALKKRMPKDLKVSYIDASLKNNEEIILMNDVYFAVRKELPVMVINGEAFCGLYACLERLGIKG